MFYLPSMVYGYPLDFDSCALKRVTGSTFIKIARISRFICRFSFFYLKKSSYIYAFDGLSIKSDDSDDETLEEEPDDDVIYCQHPASLVLIRYFNH